MSKYKTKKKKKAIFGNVHRYLGRTRTHVLHADGIRARDGGVRGCSFRFRGGFNEKIVPRCRRGWILFATGRLAEDPRRLPLRRNFPAPSSTPAARPTTQSRHVDVQLINKDGDRREQDVRLCKDERKRLTDHTVPVCSAGEKFVFREFALKTEKVAHTTTTN